jgi:tRNA nucleotidyltransferase (CCA-adding enzyme)
MHIILTHEQADFDAVASLLGAYLINEAAIPVLPRRMNRNVKAFLTLYGVDLPFVDPRDLPSQPVEQVTLVDTQSLVSVKGMSEETRVHVIDHHPLREDLPQDWSITVSGTGANTTLFIEALQEKNPFLSTIQATLLLLGIYEDTGSLTYTRTTARDLRAASFLLDQGASLRLAGDFINHPLSQHQQKLYDQLRASVELKEIHGHKIILSCGDAGEMGEELSTIVHKLRDLLDPDGLFVLVKVRGGVQLIARSTSDNIDVAKVADYFGGGGHDRAAAALVKDQDLKMVYAELVEILPEHIRPAITVSQIMSSGPQTLSPETPVEVAAQRMQRYGYEGYPVVKENRLVGLLTRRSVDRALAHKLNLNAGSLMEAGDYTVKPGDSIEHLQRLMTETGWGQIPVVHPESGQIIGIVTRTDLLKTLMARQRLPSRQNLEKHLDTALPPSRLQLLKDIARVAAEQRSALYIVGGFVRDLLLERPSLDFDLVVEGDAIQLAQALAQKYGGRVTSHTQFGTAKWHLGREKPWAGQAADQTETGGLEPGSPALPETVDFITARTEFYTYPTALPTVERGSIKLDLHRRDFTINTLALRLDGRHYGELHDYWGGYTDLRHKRVRVLHSLSFVDDPTRMLRAVRFEQRFGFTIEPRTLELLREALSLLDRVSGDRLRHEINYILLEKHFILMLSRLDELGLLAAIHPGLVWDRWVQDRFCTLLEAAPEAEWELTNRGAALEGEPGQESSLRLELMYLLWLIRLEPEQAQEVAGRLKISANLTKKIRAASGLWQEHSSFASLTPAQAVARLDEIPPEVLYALYLAVDQEQVRENLWRYISGWRMVKPTITGRELRARSLPPGPVYREILSALREAWLIGSVSTVEEEAELLERLLTKAEK